MATPWGDRIQEKQHFCSINIVSAAIRNVQIKKIPFVCCFTCLGQLASPLGAPLMRVFIVKGTRLRPNGFFFFKTGWGWGADGGLGRRVSIPQPASNKSLALKTELQRPAVAIVKWRRDKSTQPQQGKLEEWACRLNQFHRNCANQETKLGSESTRKPGCRMDVAYL